MAPSECAIWHPSERAVWQPGETWWPVRGVGVGVSFWLNRYFLSATSRRRSRQGWEQVPGAAGRGAVSLVPVDARGPLARSQFPESKKRKVGVLSLHVLTDPDQESDS